MFIKIGYNENDPSLLRDDGCDVCIIIRIIACPIKTANLRLLFAQISAKLPADLRVVRTHCEP